MKFSFIIGSGVAGEYKENGHDGLFIPAWGDGLE